MHLTLPEVPLEVAGLGVVTVCYSAFLLRRWWFSRSREVHGSPSGKLGAENAKAAQRAFGGTSSIQRLVLSVLHIDDSVRRNCSCTWML